MRTINVPAATIDILHSTTCCYFPLMFVFVQNNSV